MFYSKAGGDGLFRLYSADKLGGEWTAERLIDEFGDEFEDINYPYMMADGTTLYFAAKSAEGLGGYDIYVTRFNTDSAKFYRPENIGLPYNSKANDYYCVIDEFDNIGWLVTDRRQPAGKVCIYTFVPAETRTTYDGDMIGEDMMRSLAEIRSISDTWTDKAKLQGARNRVAGLKARGEDVETGSITFIVNDNTVYTSVDDFKYPTNRERFKKLQQMKEAADDMAEKATACAADTPRPTLRAKGAWQAASGQWKNSLNSCAQTSARRRKRYATRKTWPGNDPTESSTHGAH